MAYMNQETKAKLAPKIKAICAKYGVKASLAVRHHSTLVLNVSSGKLDFIGDFNKSAKEYPAVDSIQVNPYSVERTFTGNCKDFLTEVLEVMNTGNFDDSDIHTDYFHVGWYVDVNIGQWDKSYKLVD